MTFEGSKHCRGRSVLSVQTAFLRPGVRQHRHRRHHTRRILENVHRVLGIKDCTGRVSPGVMTGLAWGVDQSATLCALSDMSIHRACLLLLAVLSAPHYAQAAKPARSTSQAATVSTPRAAINVIYDTDMWADLDDVLALAMLHALEDRGEIKLLAVTISTNSGSSAPYVDLINTFYGRPSIPLGIIHEGMDVQVFRTRFPELTWPFTTYTQQVAESAREDGSRRYPRRLNVDDTVPDAVPLLRKTLAAQGDNSVVMIQVGFSTNLARLLRSGHDENSQLKGYDLVARKVQRLVVMAGLFNETTNAAGKPLRKGSPEGNLRADPGSAQELFAKWPTPVIVSGLEIGLAMPYHPRDIARDYSYVPDHPITESFRSFCAEMEVTKQWSCALTHSSADLTAVLYAARPDRDYFSVSNPGRIIVQDDGGSGFVESPTGRHRHLVLSAAQKDRTREAMMMLASQPPVRAPKR